jgi:Molybdopterin-guanine dinucleotide biosynthesis protein
VIVVVGGQSRKVGKTTVVCEILRATPERGWIAIKISPHAHGAGLDHPVLVEATAEDSTGSGRYFAPELRAPSGSARRRITSEKR